MDGVRYLRRWTAKQQPCTTAPYPPKPIPVPVFVRTRTNRKTADSRGRTKIASQGDARGGRCRTLSIRSNAAHVLLRDRSRGDRGSHHLGYGPREGPRRVDLSTAHRRPSGAHAARHPSGQRPGGDPQCGRRAGRRRKLSRSVRTGASRHPITFARWNTTPCAYAPGNCCPMRPRVRTPN